MTTSTQWTDLSGNEHHGALGGSSSPVLNNQTGNSYLTFNGVSHYVPLQMHIPSGAAPITQLTVEAWFRTSFAVFGFEKNWAFLDFDRSEHFNFYVRGGGKLGFSCRDAGSRFSIVRDSREGDDQSSLSDGTWHHAIVTFSAGTTTFYRDGVQSSYQGNSCVNGAGGGSTRYGFVGDGSEASLYDSARNRKHYSGDIAFVRYFNGYAMSAAEVQNEFNSRKARFASSPLLPPPAALPFPSQGVLILDGNSDTEACVHDVAATQHDGTAIAAQCCDGSTCKRRTSSSNVDCIAGPAFSSSFQYTTFQEASARCAALGYTLCDKNCQGQGCQYDNIWVWTSLLCPLPPP